MSFAWEAGEDMNVIDGGEQATGDMGSDVLTNYIGGLNAPAYPFGASSFTQYVPWLIGGLALIVLIKKK